mgnify:CR=1 FL=1
MLDNKNILITGGTGSFGQTIVQRILQKYKPKKIIIFSRDEMKQWKMSKSYENEKNLRFFIGDVRDRNRLYRAFNGVDYVVHAAALKIVPTAEYNPFECIKTNVIGSMNVIDAAIDNNVKKVVALSTDKASSPINLYGASKLASDKMFVAANYYSAKRTLFSVVRYGNVMGSRGSVIPFFLSKKDEGILPVTNYNMTRFMITIDQGVEFVLMSLKNMIGGEIFVKKIPSIKVIDIAKAISKTAKLVETGLRPGEKIHEQMIGKEDALNTFEYENYFKIIPDILMRDNQEKVIGKGKKVKEDFIYSSETNKEKLSRSFLREWINKNQHTFLKL